MNTKESFIYLVAADILSSEENKLEAVKAAIDMARFIYDDYTARCYYDNSLYEW